MDNFKLPTENAFLMFQAREALKGKWKIAVITFLVYALIMSFGGVFFSFNLYPIASFYPITVIGSIPKLEYWQLFGAGLLSLLLPLLIAGPMKFGIVVFSLSISQDKENTRIEQVFEGFKGFDKFANSFILGLLIYLFVFLWSLLLIIPGIVAFLSYSMSFYIMAENSEIRPREALRLSKRMMFGNRTKLFFLYCRFIGWYFLALLTGGIGFLWFMPYLNISIAKFYEDLKLQNF